MGTFYRSFLVLALVMSVYAQRNYTPTVTFYGGVGIAVGEGADGMNPGLSLGLEPLARIGKFYGIGGRLDYTWLTVKDLPEGYRASFHFWDVSLVQKVFAPVNSDVRFYAEADPGVYLIIMRASNEYDSHSEMQPRFGMTFGTGLVANGFCLGFKFKLLFSGDTDFGDNDQTTKWITLSIGYCGD